MAVVGSNMDDRAPRAAPPAEPRAGRLLRAIGWTTTAICVGVPLAVALGFLWFAWHLPAQEVTLADEADGIVVLTGGASRITDAIELLARHRGRRLLISGVNRTTSVGEISRLNPEFGRWVRCCVDFDHSVNTLGNAIEIRRWAERRRFRSLIVVTSDYHMPRAMAEIAHQLPDARLVPFPVVSDRLRAEPWWSHAATTKLLLSEYLKYIVARVRMRLHPASDADERA